MPIKFRMWMPDAEMQYEGPMYYQETQYLSSFLRRICDQYVVNHPSYLKFEVEDRLMQFTGSIDVNGKEIYAKDIVKRTCLDENCNLEHIGEVIYSTKWGMWGIDDKTQDRSESMDYPAPLVWSMGGGTVMGIEVLGNSYQNPELLII